MPRSFHMPPIAEPEEDTLEVLSPTVWDTSPNSDGPPPMASAFKAAAIAVQASFRFRRMLQLKVRLLRGTPASRLRACIYSIVATVRLRYTLPLLRARKRQYLSMQRYSSWQDNHTLHLFRSYAHVIVFTCKLTSVLHQKHIQCLPLDRALATISKALNFKLDQALNSGKCKVLLQLFSSIGNHLQIVRFVINNLKGPLNMDARKGLSACYYSLKELCRLLSMCTHYIQDCTGFLPARQVFAKLENINTIKFLLLELYRIYQLVAIKFEGFLNTIYDPSLQEFYWDRMPPSSPGLYMGHYLHLQAEKDVSQVLANLKQHPRLYWAGFMRNWRNTLNAAEDAALRALLSVRLNYPTSELGKVEFLKEGLFVDRKYVRVVRPIGYGSYGKVDEVICFGEKYAMKTIKGMSTIEDANEAVIQARLHHPNIVKLIWYTCNFDSQDSLSLLLDLMSCNLEDFIEQQVHKTRGILFNYPLVAVNIMMQIAKAMMYLHSQGIMHRDLKAANVLVDYTWNPDEFGEGYIHVKVADFGLSKVKKVGSQTMNSWKVGTKYWRAPEVFWQEPSSSSTDDLTGVSSTDEAGSSDHLAAYSFSADVYSFGMTCYEIVTGEKPFADLLKSGLKERILKERIVKMHERPSLPDVLHPRLKDLIEECWDGRPEKRPSFETICYRLDQIKDELLFSTPPTIDKFSALYTS